MKKGDKMQCAMLKDGAPTGETCVVTVCEIRRNGKTQAIESVRVMTPGNKTGVWVQAQYLTPMADVNAQKQPS